MNKESMTAFVCAFARAYHVSENELTVFDDYLGQTLLTDEEWSQALKHMTEGINYFEATFEGTIEEKLNRVMNHYISPTILARSAYAEKMLKNAVGLGADQYLIFGAGYDTFGLRKPEWAEGLRVIELDHPLTMKGKKDRLERIQTIDWQKDEDYKHLAVDFSSDTWKKDLVNSQCINRNKISFCSLLGLTYYLKRESFIDILGWIGQTFPEGTAIVFDYPDNIYYSELAEDRIKKQVAMAKMAGENMCAGYEEEELIAIMEKAGLFLYEHLSAQEISDQFFKDYNKTYPDRSMHAPENVHYCLAVVKK